MRIPSFFLLLLLTLSLLSCSNQPQKAPSSPPRPNIVYILADDLGYGDLSLYQANGGIRTPHLDALGKAGLYATDAHSPSSICTPTRYGIMTGRYAWKSRMKRGVVWSYGPAILEPARTTLPEFLQEAGYHTACIGKWHLGLDWAKKGEETLQGQRLQGTYGKESELSEADIDFSRPITDGPNEHGFDYSYVLPASLDIPPYCYVENHQLVTPPSSQTEGNDLNAGKARAFWRPGAMAPDFDFEGVLPNFIDQATAYVSRQAQNEDPFFLYLPLPAPHTPWLPVDSFQNRSEAGMYGGFVEMVDAQIGRLLQQLAELDLEDNTLVIFTSDNGPYWRPEHMEETGHRAAGPLRGMKGDIWEAGHRVPFLARWPEEIPAGSRSDALISLTDGFATVAGALGLAVPAGQAEDSHNQWPVLTGVAGAAERQQMVHHSSKPIFALRAGNWKYIPHWGSAGFTPEAPSAPVNGPAGQLYDLSSDLAETNNQWAAMPDSVAAFEARLAEETRGSESHSE